LYSFAIIIWELIARKPLYDGMMSFQIAIEVGTQGKRPPIPSEQEVSTALHVHHSASSNPNIECGGGGGGGSVPNHAYWI
jgi:hypothetical protein